MYYLTVRNLGVERCIYRNETDVFVEGMSFNCNPDYGFPECELVKELKIRCSEVPHKEILAMVYRD